MKKILFIAIIMTLGLSMQAQKYAFVDTEYILKNIPAFEAANEQLNQSSQKWQKEIEAVYAEVETLYQNYQTENVFLSNEMKVKKEEEIVAKEKAARQLQAKYFGAEGELSKKREALIKPIQDDVYNAIREMANDQSYAAIFDKAAGGVLLFSDPKYDISDDILEKLGYKK
ncbi:periplasmic chaperone for outer membrane proteins Skp [Saccharicrinis carchari]|uniref:Periplasmic chaperone for outer membrane proteins Skp n=1 Tax=Saccharicrinis carchari TaxID=1168039 RepID=A0A521CMH6_SACCC|nr:OmpH family outer membrane protein [Saccharicrinis carchari]SMO60649.1 periplasmic chaperone for outer membrane proteins Skp [Saccharicrinis carchari]